MTIGTRTGLHHLHKRKRISELYAPYPHPKRFYRFFDKFMFAVAIIGPILGLPQLVKIWINQSAAGLSLISWTAFTLVSICWVIYGFLHKTKQIIISSVAWVIIHLLIVIGIIIF